MIYVTLYMLKYPHKLTVRLRSFNVPWSKISCASCERAYRPCIRQLAVTFTLSFQPDFGGQQEASENRQGKRMMWIWTIL